MSNTGKSIKITFIGGGSVNWAPSIIRDIIFKSGMEEVGIDFSLLDLDLPRAQDIKTLFDVKLKEWQVNHVRLNATTDPVEAITGADFVIIAISTGRLGSMKHDLEIPEKYGIYHTVGDASGPGGWSRSLRNIPVFKAYAKQIKELAPNAYVLNYTNPMGTLTKVMADELGANRVVGLCHGLFECYDILKAVFELESEEDIKVIFGGLNHFFWILDLKIKGEDGYRLIREKLNGRNFATLIKEVHLDGMGWSSDKWLAGELLDNYGYLPYVGDRHTCEFFNCYLTNLDMLERFKLVRTTIADREKVYETGGEQIKRWTTGEEVENPLTKEPSRETAADIIKAVLFDEGFTDVVNTVNAGQIPELPLGAVVETMGHFDAQGVTPLTMGNMPESLVALLLPHAMVQLRTTDAGLSGNLDDALMTLAADPVCASMTISDIKKMGLELLRANEQYLPQFDLQ